MSLWDALLFEHYFLSTFLLMDGGPETENGIGTMKCHPEIIQVSPIREGHRDGLEIHKSRKTGLLQIIHFSLLT